MNADTTPAPWRPLGVIAWDQIQTVWKQSAADFVSCDKHLGALEHYIHEVCHAFILGFEVGEDTPQRVSLALEQMAEREQIVQEAVTWAVEWLVWKALSLPMEWNDITAAAEIQRVGEGDIVAHLDDPETKRLAEKVVEHLLTL